MIFQNLNMTSKTHQEPSCFISLTDPKHTRVIWIDAFINSIGRLIVWNVIFVVIIVDYFHFIKLLWSIFFVLSESSPERKGAYQLAFCAHNEAGQLRSISNDVDVIKGAVKIPND